MLPECIVFDADLIALVLRNLTLLVSSIGFKLINFTTSASIQAESNSVAIEAPAPIELKWFFRLEF